MMTTARTHVREQHIQGFTLVETLVAIAILMIAIIGPFYSIQQAITTSYASRDQLIATSLAQEGIEYIYFLRDNNYLAGNPWTQGMNPCMTNLNPYGCTVDPSASSGSLASCNSGGCVPINLTSNGIYTQASDNAATRFTRTVKISTVSVDQIQMTSQVTWTSNHQSYSSTVSESLYNWL